MSWRRTCRPERRSLRAPERLARTEKMKPESTTPAFARTSPIFPELAPSGMVTVTLPVPSPPKGWANALTSHSRRTITTRMATIAAIRAGPRRPRVRGPRGTSPGGVMTVPPRRRLRRVRRWRRPVGAGSVSGRLPARARGGAGGSGRVWGRGGRLGPDLAQRAIGDGLTALGGVLPGDVEVVGIGGGRHVAAGSGELV